EAHAMDGADDREALAECFEPRLQMITDETGIFLQSVVAHGVEDRHADDAADRAAAPGGAEITLPFKAVGGHARGDDRADGLAVAHALVEGDEGRSVVLSHEAPEVAAEASVADLTLVGDA